MKQYKIYSNPEGVNEAVKQGWSWPAFFFTAFWALVKKLWAIGIGVFVLFFVLGVIEGAIGVSEGEEAAQAMSGLTGILTLIVAVIFGVNGNKLREKNLQSRGYDSQDLTTADNPEAAIALWMKERQDRTP